MIKKWEVKPAPSRSDPKRCRLLIDGQAADVHQLIKKIGALCGRPEKASAPYTYSMYIMSSGLEAIEKVEKVMSQLSSGQVERKASVARPEGSGAQVSAASALPLPAEKESQKVVKNIPPAGKTVAETSPVPAASAGSSTTQASESGAATRNAPSGDKSFSAGFMGMLELPLVPIYSFETLIVGPHNRFAHAASAAVVENPGTMYNPLLLFGNPGTGKTHLLHSVAYGLSSALGHENILITDGVRLSKSVHRLLRENGISKMEALFEKIKAVMVDDIHLMILDAGNQQYISRWFNSLLGKGKQLVFTSAYPPGALSGLENSLGFHFGQGWVVDLKPPSSQSYAEILRQMLEGRYVVLSEEESSAVFCRGSMPLGEVVRILRNMRRLDKLLPPHDPPLSHAALLEMLLGGTEAGVDAGLSEDEIKRALEWTPPASGKWGRWGVFYPKNSRDRAHWAIRKLEQRAVEMGISGSWEQVFMSEYDSDQLYGVPFKLGDYSDSRKINGAVLLGPHPGSGLGAQEQEFRRVTAKILECMNIRCGWMGFSQIRSPSAYVRLLLDLIP